MSLWGGGGGGKAPFLLEGDPSAVAIILLRDTKYKCSF